MNNRRLLATASLLLAGAARAHIGHLGSVEVTGHYDNAVGTTPAASAGVVGAGLIDSRALARPGDVLEFVPGVVVTQHAGSGKANQYFLRGFNLDHGTDFATRVNGVPVNLPTHGHGQGYADLNFLIPELVQRIEYHKGPYAAAHGDFSSAGAAEVSYRLGVASPYADLQLGQHGHRRALGVASGGDAALRWLGAVEAARNDGPWTVPERLRRHNAVFSLSGTRGTDTAVLSLMAYRSTWTSTDQVPERALRSGLLGRFDSLDPTAGGDTHRVSLSAQWQRKRGTTVTRADAWLLDYALELDSNFTYALERPDAGDAFKQTDRRRAGGLELAHAVSHALGGLDARSEFGLQLRHDRIRVGLHDSVARHITATVRDDRVRQTLASAWGQSEVELGPTLRVVGGLRADHMANRVEAITQPDNGGRSSGTLVSPRLSLVAGPFRGWIGGPDAPTELFVNAGRGFHSNDARGTTTRIDPRSGDAVDPVPALVRSTGWELGLRTEPAKGLQSSLALWALRFDSELVYVGDAGTNEPGAASRRRGVEWSNRWVPVPWLLFDADLAWSHARLADGSRIPNAVERVASLGVALRQWQGWSASLHGRWIGPAPLIEDNSIRSRPSNTLNLRVARLFGGGMEASVEVLNLLDRRNDDIQYAYVSRLPGEDAAGVLDRHVHPGAPRQWRLALRLPM